MRLTSRSSKSTRLVLGLGLLALATLPQQAHAAGLLAAIQDMLAQYIPSSDESMAMLRQVFGDFVLNPFSQSSTGAGLLAQMFGQFNMFIFTVAMIWFSYTAMSALAHTMHEGVVFGQRMSTVWLPLRVGFGAVSLVPMFGGWALCQALMMTGAALGIAGANALTQTAINAAGGFSALVNGSASIKSSSQMVDVEKNLLQFVACVKATNEKNIEENALVGSGLPTNLAVQATRTRNGLQWSFPSNGGTTGCGVIKETFSPRGINSTTSFSATSAFGFRINGIDYDGIRMQAMTAHEGAMTEMIRRAELIATGAADKTAGSAAYAQAVALLHDGYLGAYPPLVDQGLAAIAASAGARSSTIDTQLRANMLSGGWATLGTWYQTFAEVNEAMNEMLDPVILAEAPKTSESSVHIDLMDGITAASIQATGRNDLTSPTGNTSIGQWLMKGVINFTVGANSTGAGEMINPIIAFKNLGDNAIVLAETIYVAKKAIDVAGDIPGAGTLGKAAGWLAGKTGLAGGAFSFVKSIVSDFGALLVPIGFILFGTAAMMAFYIPMIPFIQWFAALLNWFGSIIESLVGSSLWALAHFDADGEGMGQRASYGYLYLFNNFARPIVLVFGFFVASAGINVLGTFLFKYFGQAVANAQGESLTGLVSIVAYLVIFVVLGTTLVSSMFNLTLHMADRVIGFVGTGIQSALGHDVENRVSGVFLNASGRTMGAMERGGPKGPSMASSVQAGVEAAMKGSGGLGGAARGAAGVGMRP